MAANSNVLPATATKASATQDSSEFAAFCRHSGLGVRMWRPCKNLEELVQILTPRENTSLTRAAPLKCTPLWLLMDKKFCVTWWKMSPSECGPMLQGQWHAWLSIFFQSDRYCSHFQAELYCCYCHCQWGRALHVRRKHSWILRALSMIWSLVLCPHLVASLKWCFISFCEGRFQVTVDVQIWGAV